MDTLKEAYLSVYKTQLDEALDPEERALRRAEIADKKSSRMGSKEAKKYADSESKSAEREDKKSKGKHIYGMADSYQPEGEVVDEKKDDSYLETDMKKRKKNNEKAVDAMKKTKAYSDMVKAASKHFEEFVTEEDPCWKGYTQVGMKKKNGKEVPNCVPSKGVPKAKGYKKEDTEIQERALESGEKTERERLVKGMKKSAKDFKQRYGERAKSVMYATATKLAKEEAESPQRTRTPSQMAKREKLTKLLNQIKDKKAGGEK